MDFSGNADQINKSAF